jgi:hypothetical protein
MTERTERIAQQVILRHKLPLEIARGKPTDLSGVDRQALLAGPLATSLYGNLGAPVFRFGFFDIAVDYGDGPMVCDNTPKMIRWRIKNTYKVQANLNIRWYAPANWRVVPAGGMIISFPAPMGQAQELVFTVQTERVEQPMSRLVVELTSDGRPTVMLVPITLLNGNLYPRQGADVCAPQEG